MLLDTFKKEIQSPCIRNCCLDENDVCVGCFRSLDEILQWSKVDEEGKRFILMRTQTRRKIASDIVETPFASGLSNTNVKAL